MLSRCHPHSSREMRLSDVAGAGAEAEPTALSVAVGDAKRKVESKEAKKRGRKGANDN
jgi:hypothetical protein